MVGSSRPRRSRRSMTPCRLVAPALLLLLSTHVVTSAFNLDNFLNVRRVAVGSSTSSADSKKKRSDAKKGSVVVSKSSASSSSTARNGMPIGRSATHRIADFTNTRIKKKDAATDASGAASAKRGAGVGMTSRPTRVVSSAPAASAASTGPLKSTRRITEFNDFSSASKSTMSKTRARSATISLGLGGTNVNGLLSFGQQQTQQQSKRGELNVARMSPSGSRGSSSQAPRERSTRSTPGGNMSLGLGGTNAAKGLLYFAQPQKQQKPKPKRGELNVAHMAPINGNGGGGGGDDPPIRNKMDRRSPTRVLSKPAKNARSTMVLGGDKVKASPKKKTSATSVLSSSSSSASSKSGGGVGGGSFSFDDFQIPFTKTSINLENGMTNDGPFAWMVPYVDLFGYRKGKTLVGAIPQDIDASAAAGANLSEQEKAARRAQAEEELTNISPEERERRAEAAATFLKVAGGYAALSSLILDDGSIMGHLYRFAVLPFLFAWRGYDLSAKSGL